MLNSVTNPPIASLIYITILFRYSQTIGRSGHDRPRSPVEIMFSDGRSSHASGSEIKQEPIRSDRNSEISPPIFRNVSPDSISPSPPIRDHVPHNRWSSSKVIWVFRTIFGVIVQCQFLFNYFFNGNATKRKHMGWYYISYENNDMRWILLYLEHGSIYASI